MNKQELVKKIAADSELTQKQAAAALEATIAAIKSTVAAGDKVQLVGFGTFERKERAARTGHNPRTGKTVKIKAAKLPAFKAGKAFKEEVNAKKK